MVTLPEDRRELPFQWWIGDGNGDDGDFDTTKSGHGIMTRVLLSRGLVLIWYL